MAVNLRSLGLAVGHVSDDIGATGVTVVRGIEEPFRAGCALLGRATGTRELDALSPRHLVDRVDALVLAGGSAFGLDSAGGVMRWMEERGRGFPVGVGVVPIVPAAVVFDLAPCGSPSARPTATMAYEACDLASPDRIAEGSVGAGTGTTVGKAAGPDRAMKGGVGLAVETAGYLHVAALAVVNALGDVRDGAGRIIAGARADTGFVDLSRALASGSLPPESRFATGAMQNTTLAVVMTNASLSREELTQLAGASSVALGKRISPVGTSFDGDVVFSVSPLRGPQFPALQIEALAVVALESAIERAVRTARGRDGIPGLADGS
ncbi:MAG: P1 family peptidase [Gemmatimonadaceae bacterium]